MEFDFIWLIWWKTSGAVFHYNTYLPLSWTRNTIICCSSYSTYYDCNLYIINEYFYLMEWYLFEEVHERWFWSMWSENSKTGRHFVSSCLFEWWNFFELREVNVKGFELFYHLNVHSDECRCRKRKKSRFKFSKVSLTERNSIRKWFGDENVTEVTMDIADTNGCLFRRKYSIRSQQRLFSRKELKLINDHFEMVGQLFILSLCHSSTSFLGRFWIITWYYGNNRECVRWLKMKHFATMYSHRPC